MIMWWTITIIIIMMIKEQNHIETKIINIIKITQKTNNPNDFYNSWNHSQLFSTFQFKWILTFSVISVVFSFKIKKIKKIKKI